jgi:hypothetical protein
MPVEGGSGRSGIRLHLTFTISPTGDVTSAQATGNNITMTLWPQLQREVYQWKFIPFEQTQGWIEPGAQSKSSPKLTSSRPPFA